MTEHPPSVLASRYALEEELGRSGTGTSWRARDTVLDRIVTVKVIAPDLVADRGFTERLGHELRAVALASHPGLTRLLDTGRDDGISFIVREHVDGESLRAILDRDGHLSAERAAAMMGSLLEALSVAHAADVVHLDLKPENVLVGSDGSVHLSDLAIGPAVLSIRLPDEAARILDPAPLAPELWSGAAPDAQTDVWEMGALLYEMVTGGVPTGTPSEDGTAALPPALRAIVARAMALDPSMRFGSTQEFAGALRAAPELEAAAATGPVGGSGLDASAVSPGPVAASREPRFATFRTWLAVPLLVLLVAGGAVGAGLWVGELQLGGPVGIRFKPPESPSPGDRGLSFLSVAPFDPFGDGHENDAGLPDAADGDPSTVWKSEAYRYPGGGMGKPGVGMLFDLGGDHTVTGFRLQTPYPGYRFTVLVGNDPTAMVSTARARFTASTDMRGSIRPTTGRYVLLWITSVVPTADGNRAEVADFRVSGPA